MRTHDFLLGKQTLYHWVTPATTPSITISPVQNKGYTIPAEAGIQSTFLWIPTFVGMVSVALWHCFGYAVSS